MQWKYCSYYFSESKTITFTIITFGDKLFIDTESADTAQALIHFDELQMKSSQIYNSNL